jgi:hypothetical protein
MFAIAAQSLRIHRAITTHSPRDHYAIATQSVRGNFAIASQSLRSSFAIAEFAAQSLLDRCELPRNLYIMATQWVPNRCEIVVELLRLLTDSNQVAVAAQSPLVTLSPCNRLAKASQYHVRNRCAIATHSPRDQYAITTQSVYGKSQSLRSSFAIASQ